MAFDWHGKNSDGVPQYIGDGDRPTKWSIYGCLVGSILFGVSAAAVIAAVLLEGGARPTATLLLIGIAGLFDVLFFGGIGLWKLRLRREIGRLVPEAELGARLGLQDTEIAEIVRIKGIRPRLGINYRSYYALEDFDDAASLLRWSARTADPNAMLRAAVPSADDSDALLRASDHSVINNV